MTAHNREAIITHPTEKGRKARNNKKTARRGRGKEASADPVTKRWASFGNTRRGRPNIHRRFSFQKEG